LIPEHLPESQTAFISIRSPDRNGALDVRRIPSAKAGLVGKSDPRGLPTAAPNGAADLVPSLRQRADIDIYNRKKHVLEMVLCTRKIGPLPICNVDASDFRQRVRRLRERESVINTQTRWMLIGEMRTYRPFLREIFANECGASHRRVHTAPVIGATSKDTAPQRKHLHLRLALDIERAHPEDSRHISEIYIYINKVLEIIRDSDVDGSALGARVIRPPEQTPQRAQDHREQLSAPR